MSFGIGLDGLVNGYPLGYSIDTAVTPRASLQSDANNNDMWLQVIF